MSSDSFSYTGPKPTPERSLQLSNNIKLVRDQISTISSSKPVNLLAVSKYKPIEDIISLYENDNQRNFGENYVQELILKYKQLPKDIKWHFIGSLQSNKIKDLITIKNLDTIETLDSIKKANKLNNLLNNLKDDSKRSSKLNVFIQINTSNEINKNGIDYNSKNDILNLSKFIINDCSNTLNLKGLMTIGSIEQSKHLNDNDNEKEIENKDFKNLVELSNFLNNELNLSKPLELSMGMSSDYEDAIKMGSTNVRIGSTIFGSRHAK